MESPVHITRCCKCRSLLSAAQAGHWEYWEGRKANAEIYSILPNAQARIPTMIELEGHFMGIIKIHFVYFKIRTNEMIDMSRVAKNTVASDFSDAAFFD